MHFLFGFSNEERSARFPSTKDKPPRRIDLPAPVSPVMQVIPEEKEASSSSIKAKFFIVSCVSKAFQLNNLKIKDRDIKENYAFICFHLDPKKGAIFLSTASVDLNSTLGPSLNKLTISSTFESKKI